MDGLKQLRRALRINSSMPTIVALLPAQPRKRLPAASASAIGELGAPLAAPLVRC